MLAGETVIEPFIGINPMPLSNEAESACSDDQVSVDVSPSIMVRGWADMLTCGGCSTKTVADAVAVPPGPVSVIV